MIKNKNEELLKLCTLSGTNEVGRNCNFIELGKDILIVDAGFSFPGEEMYGIDYLLPNVKYLANRKKDIKGILITHGHLDHIGALQYILPDLGFPPIFAGEFACAIIAEKLSEANLLNKVKINVVRRGEVIRLGAFRITFIGINHSIPDSSSIFIESPKGNILVSGDYKIDDTPVNEPRTNVDYLRSLQGKVDIALLESTYAGKPGKARSESEAAVALERIISVHKGRVIVSAFASLVSRLYSLLKIAQKTGRKVVLSGRSLHTMISIAVAQHYLDIPNNLIIDEREMKKYMDNQLMLITTGSQAERYAALNRIALGEHKFIQAKKTDLVIMSSSEIPENINRIEGMTDKLIRQGIDLIKNSEEDGVHASGHGMQEDMKIFYELIKPKYVMPVHGSLTMRYQSKKNYLAWGHPEDKVLLTEDGQVWSYDGNTLKKSENIESRPIMIDGLGTMDTGDIVLRDRKQLAEYGIFVIVLNINSKTKTLIGRPRFVSRGFIYMKTGQEILKEIENIVLDTHREWMRDKKKELSELSFTIEKRVSKLITQKTEREPIVLISII
jgi:ribonuclease J